MMRRGVRYYRAVAPPEADWAGDYAAIAAAGFDFVVVPVPWSLCHLGDDEFGFTPLLRQLDLAREHHLGLVAAIDVGVSPGWLTRRHPECLHEDALGRKAAPRATLEAPGGGWPGLCLDHGIARSHARRFLQAVASASAPHPALEAYDLSGYEALRRHRGWKSPGWFCHCSATRALFVAWLRRTYGDDLGLLRRAWRSGHTDWRDVGPPPPDLSEQEQDSTPEMLDWVRFLRDNAATKLRGCVAALREIDADRPLLASEEPVDHDAATDALALASEVTDLGCRVNHCPPDTAIDYTRAGAGGKRLWVTGMDTQTVADLRLAQWRLLCSGADTAVYDGWRPEPLAGLDARPALARPDGSASPRLDVVAQFGHWLAQHPELASARPAPAEAAVVLVRETQQFVTASHPGSHAYAEAIQGAYKALTARGVRVELVLPEALGGYPLAYVPMADALSAATADALRRYVDSGGCLVAEAGIAQLDERGLALRRSPGHGLDELFGAFALDVADPGLDEPRPTFKGRRATYPCYGRRQPLQATTGKVKATFVDDGTAAIVDNAFGAGCARLIGTRPSYGYLEDGSKPCAQVVLDSLAYAKVRPRAVTSSPAVCVRLLEGDGVHFLCAFNTASTPQEAAIGVSGSVGRFRTGVDLVTGKPHRLRGNGRRVKLGPAEGLVLRLEPGRLARLRLRPRWRRREKGKNLSS